MDPIEGEFICRKCQSPLSIDRILVSKKGFAIFEVRCQKKHDGKRKFNMAQQTEWMPSVIKHLYICPRCNSNLTDIRQKTEGDKTVLLLNCPTHGKMKKVVSTSFWYAMDALRKQLSARPAYPAAYPGPYQTQYPPGSYPPPYTQPGYQQPPSPYAAPPPTGTTPPPPPPETISPPQFEVNPPIQTTNKPVSPTSPSSAGSPSLENDLGAGDICPACGEPISPGAKFCTNCGTELE